MNSIKGTSTTATTAAAKILLGLFLLGQLATLVHSQCFQDESMNAQWARLINGDETSTTFNIDGTCCQDAVCNIPCAADVPPPPKVNSILLFWWWCLSHLSSCDYSLSPIKTFVEYRHIASHPTFIYWIRIVMIGIWYCSHHFHRTLRYYWVCHINLCQGRERELLRGRTFVASMGASYHLCI